MASTCISESKRKFEDIGAFDGIAPSASSSTSKCTQKPLYDVFINHRGPDVKSTLATVLYSMLTGMALSVFLDSQELEYGDFLPQAIEAAMASTLLHIAIFSKRYAESPWCLAELVFMVKSGARIIPIFYHVDPSDLRWVDQGKGIYAEAFEGHEWKGTYSREHLQEWKKALHDVSFYAGQIINTNEDEMLLLKNIANIVLKEVNYNIPLMVAKHPVCLEKIVEDFEMNTLKPAQRDQHVQIVGILGMGGSGKTTLAKALFNKSYSSMERISFVFDVRDSATKSLLDKQKKLLRDLGFRNLRFDHIEEGMSILSNCLRFGRILIVLDDVDDIKQLDALLPAKGNLRSGSLIIVTTRAHDVFKTWGISFVHRMKPLDAPDANELFCWHAFLKSCPPHEFNELVDKFIFICHGLPLCLVVFGAQLYGEFRKEFWVSFLHKISRILPDDIQNKLKISYDILDDEEKEMFLDIACFFVGEKISLAIELWSGLGYSAQYSWEKLVHKCLVEVGNENTIRMHDSIRNMGRNIAKKQSPYRLSFPQQTINTQNRKKKRMGIRGIVATSTHNQRFFAGVGVEGVRGMLGKTEVDEFCVGSSKGKLRVKTNAGIWLLAPSVVGLKFLVISGDSFNEVLGEVSRELVWLRWFQIGRRSLPSGLLLKNLRVLELYENYSGHHLEELWETDSEVPLQLRELLVSHCYKFQGFPKSIGNLKYLKKLIISEGCNALNLPDEFCLLQSLEHLALPRSKLLSLPMNFGNLRNLRYLDFSWCGQLRSLPASFKSLILLEHLNLQGCRQLSFTSEDLNFMENIIKLEYLNVEGCELLEALPRHIANQASLRQLYFRNTSLGKLPDGIGQLSRLTWMVIEHVLLTSLPASFGDLSSLEELWIQRCPELECVPDSLGNLSSLTELVIEMCPKLERHGKKSLQKAIRKLSNLQRMTINRCPITGSSLYFGSSNLKFVQVGETQVRRISFSGGRCCAHLETQLDVYDNHHLEEIEALPGTLQSISLRDCEMLKNVPSFAGMTSLRKISIHGCCKIEKIEGMPRTLKSISLEKCEMLKSISSFAELISLGECVVYDCCEVEKIEGLEKCTGLTKLTVDTCWEVLGIESLEHLRNLKQLAVRASKGSAIQHCIRTIRRWPDEITICARAVPEAASRVDSLLSNSNVVIVDSISNQKIKLGPKLVKKNAGSSINGDAFMLCLVTNCLPSQKTLYIGNAWNRPFSIKLEEGRWAWVGVFTEHCDRDFLRTDELCISEYGECGEEEEVEKGLLVRGEEQALLEVLHGLFPLFQS